jgi:hypothetical protein
MLSCELWDVPIPKTIRAMPTPAVVLVFSDLRGVGRCAAYCSCLRINAEQIQGPPARVQPVQDIALFRTTPRGAREESLQPLGRNTDHAIGVPDNDVTSANQDLTDNDRRRDTAARSRPLGRAAHAQAASEDRKAYPVQGDGVADVTVDHHSAEVPLGCRRRQDLAPIPVLVATAARHDEHRASRCQVNGPVNPEVVARTAVDREGRPAQLAAMDDRDDRGRENSAIAGRLVHRCRSTGQEGIQVLVRTRSAVAG